MPTDRDTAASSEVATTASDPVRTSGWAWRWTGWASWPVSPAVLWVCAVAVTVDVATSWWGQPAWYLGRVSMSPALPLGVLLVALIGPRNLGFSRRSLSAWCEFLIIGVPTLVVWCISYPQSVAEFRDVEGIVVAVAGEELVYRLATVVLIGAACARIAGRNWRDTAQWGTGPAVGGLVGAGLVFSALPGHVDQMTGAANVLPFLSLAVLLGYVALRSGSLIPGFLVHLTIDLAALAYFAGTLPNSVRLVVDIGALVALELGLMLAGRRLGLRRRMPRVIDLREPARVAPTPG
jgi:Type II CAAX prenyl endopeptidase Rce1-like